ncbi:hypothetical protein MOOR_28530 [Moorella thermoacetica]|uniref:Uncharacterized protein n=1 Tax=Neomoorella thermoacetica TaxID=1525 RepID=A0A1J5JSK8_NEOTH|nr:hypothetical protein MOOR_28530 [Moorella thermoacetica]
MSVEFPGFFTGVTRYYPVHQAIEEKVGFFQPLLEFSRQTPFPRQPQGYGFEVVAVSVDELARDYEHPFIRVAFEMAETVIEVGRELAGEGPRRGGRYAVFRVVNDAGFSGVGYDCIDLRVLGAAQDGLPVFVRVKAPADGGDNLPLFYHLAVLIPAQD